jgi:hypothetical protein
MIMVLFVGFRFEAYAPLITGGLYESASLKLITCVLTVNRIRQLFETTLEDMHTTLLSDLH